MLKLTNLWINIIIQSTDMIKMIKYTNYCYSIHENDEQLKLLKVLILSRSGYQRSKLTRNLFFTFLYCILIVSGHSGHISMCSPDFNLLYPEIIYVVEKIFVI